MCCQRGLWVMYGLSWAMYGMSWVMYGNLWAKYGSVCLIPKCSPKLSTAPPRTESARFLSWAKYGFGATKMAGLLEKLKICRG